MSIFQVTLENTNGLRVTLTVDGRTSPDQPYDMAESRANNHPDHARHGPWKAINTKRV